MGTTVRAPELPENVRAAVARLAVLGDTELARVDAWWRAANFLTVGQICLRSNALLRRPLTVTDIKPRLLGHWGTSPGLSFVYAHASRLIRHTGQRMIYLTGPGHGGPALVAASWLEGTYGEIYPQVGRDAAGAERLVRRFSTPGGIPSHVSVTTPGVDPRGWGAGLCAGARLRRGDGQPGPRRAGRGR
ncbi:hypothetical protein [Pseudonocardia sp. H11422]|uniref:hypothetical protein n=1 Tax=Pseudonocardia sp. H11422 TaxID=2835866 RepID=UPI0027E39132|nr:hypothetical protein [Pseudonocardia sp. H11422]